MALKHITDALRGEQKPQFSTIESRMSGLGAAISDGIDDLANVDGDGDASAGAGGEAGAPEEAPSPAVAEPAAAPPAAPVDEDADAPRDTFRIEPKAPKSAQDPAASPTVAAVARTAQEPTSDGGVDPAVKNFLALADTDLIDAIKKYRKIEDIKTPEQLREATKLAGRSYWDNVRRLSELSGGKAAGAADPNAVAATAAGAPASGPAATTHPDLAFYDAQIQSLKDKGQEALDNIKGWQEEEQSVLAEIADLKGKRARGESFDDSALNNLYEQLEGARTNQRNWKSTWQGHFDKFNEVQIARKHRADVLSINQAREAQERDAQTAEVNKVNDRFAKLWEEGVDKYAVDHAIPADKLPQMKKLLSGLTIAHRVQSGQPFDEKSLDAFLATAVEEYASDHGYKKAEAQRQYAGDKAGDAPKPTATATRRVPQSAAAALKAKRSVQPSLRHLESEIMGADIE